MPSWGEIFTDFGHDGWRTSFREFLGYFVKQFWPGVNTQIDKLPFMRIDYPLLALPFFALALWALFRFWGEPTPRRAALAGAAAGLLFYVYFSAWVYVVVALAVLSIVALAIERGSWRSFGVLWITLAVVAVPFFVNYLQFTGPPDHTDFLYRQWLAEGRVVGLAALGYAYLAYALVAFGIWRLAGRRDRRRALLPLALIAAMFLVWNVQLVTGYVPAPDHWKRIVSPVLYVILWWLGYEVVRALSRRWTKLPAIAAVLFILAAGLAVTKKVVNVASLARGLQPWVAQKYAFPQELVDSWQWMDANLSGEPKVISPSSMTSQYLAVYTRARPYLPYGILTPLPMAEIEERFLAANRLFEVPENLLRAELGDLDKVPPDCAGPECFDQRLNFTKTRFNLYGCYFFREPFNTAVNRACAMPDAYRDLMVERYRRIAADWRTIGAEYVYYGPHERQLGKVAFNPQRFERVYQNPLVQIYRILR